VTDADGFHAMVDATVDRFGSVDILVNNAGIQSTPRLLKDISEAQWDREGTEMAEVGVATRLVLPGSTGLAPTQPRLALGTGMPSVTSVDSQRAKIIGALGSSIPPTSRASAACTL
jgi:hypothetical protein